MRTPPLIPQLDALLAVAVLLLTVDRASAGSSLDRNPSFALPGGIVSNARSTKYRYGTTAKSSRHSRRSSSVIFVPRRSEVLGLSFLIYDRSNDDDDDDGSMTVKPCRSIGNTLLRGALLRIASDLTGGTPLESIKTRVAITTEGPVVAVRNIIQAGGIGALYTGTPSRTIEGALVGAVFMLGSTLTKAQLRRVGAVPTAAALAGGLVGGVLQAAVMTPAGLIFTTLNSSNKSGKKDTTMGVVQRVLAERGLGGMFAGTRPMCLRQATNWASRSGLTEISRTVLGLSEYGLMGELLSGVIGGVGSCWNTPIETIRVITQCDVSQGKSPKSMQEYWNDIVMEQGYAGLFRGVTPRAMQATWQTIFLVVVPNLMGI